MAAKVNTKFVAVLVGVLVLMAGGVAGAAYLVLFKSAADLAKQGDALMAAGKPTEAEKAFGKAVAKETTNVEYLRKWRDSLDKLTPPTQTLFDAKYPYYSQVRKKIADLLKTDVQAHRDNLDVYQQTLENAGYSRQYAEAMAQAATDALAQFLDDKDGKAQALRRYRALANLRILTESRNLKDTEIEAIKADFEAALAADPADVDSVIGLHNWYIYKADEALQNQRPDEAIKWAEQGRDVVRTFRKSEPDEPRTKSLYMTWLLADARRQAQSLNKQEDRKKVAEQLRVEGTRELDEAGALLMKMDPAKISATMLSQFAYLEMQLDTTGKMPRSLAAVDRAIAARPQDASLLMGKSEIQAVARDFPGAIATLEKVRELPNPTLGVAGRMQWYRKNDAVFRQAALSLKALETATDPDPAKEKQLRAEWMEKAKARRAELAKIDPETSPRMLFIDGKLKLAQEDYGGAQQLLLSYLNFVNQADPEGLLAAANASYRLNQPGKAQDLLNKALQINGTNVQAMVMLAEVEMRLRNTERAAQLYELAEALVPDNAQIKARRKAVMQEAGKADFDDPVDKLLAEVRKRREMGDEKGSAQLMRDNLEPSKYDMRIVRQLVSDMANSNDVEGAKALVQKAIAANPNEAQKKSMQDMLSVLDAGDAVTAQMRAIDLNTTLTPVDKLVVKLGVLSNGGEKYKEQAQAIATEMEQKFPDEPMVIEALFIKALREKRFDAAQPLADKATARNSDKYEGATFKARLLAAQGKRAEAITVLAQASQKFNFNVEAWRVLAALQVEDGKLLDATQSMQRALNLRPDDATSILQYAATLQAANQTDEALKLLREKTKLNDSIMLRDEWLRLEGIGGDRELALKEREKDLVRDPSNRSYKVQVAALNTDLRRWDDAKRRIDDVRKTQDGLDVVTIAATWSADQSDLESSEKVYRDYIGKNKDDKAKALEGSLAMARFMVSRGRPDRAVVILTEAQALQDPKLVQADRLLAELYLDGADSEKAIETLRRVSQADPADDTVRLRLAEALVQARQFDAAEQELQKLSKQAQDGAVAMLLRADAAMGRGDPKTGMEILDKAVTAFSNNAGVFLKRGQASMEAKRNVADTLADLDQAIKLDPRLWQAHQLKAALYQSQGKKNEVISEIRAILAIDPSQDEILGLGLRMMVADARDDEAVALAEDVAKRRGAPGVLYANVGDLFDMLGRSNRALAFYKQAFTIDPRTDHVVRYVNALLSQKPANVNEAEATLTKVQDRIAKDPELLLARAGVRRVRNQLPEARKDTAASLKALPNEQAGAMQAWFQAAYRLLGAKELLATLDQLSKDGLYPDWIAFFKGRLKADDANPETKLAGIDDILKVAQTAKNPGLATLAYKENAGRLYIAGKMEPAAEAMKAIIAKNPNDADTLNNLAYLLGKDLNRPAEGLEYAKRAVDLLPKSPEVLDTYGMLLMMTGKNAEAQKVLDRAIAISSTPSTQVTVLLHIAELQLAEGKKDEARASLGKARTLFQQVQSLTQAQQKADLERLEKLVEAS